MKWYHALQLSILFMLLYEADILVRKTSEHPNWFGLIPMAAELLASAYFFFKSGMLYGKEKP